MGRLQDRVAVIAGSDSGIGQADVGAPDDVTGSSDVMDGGLARLPGRGA